MDLLNRMADFNPARDTALHRLEQFAPFAGKTYREERNFDYGPQDRSNVSVLSPHIRHRLITEEEIVRRVLADKSLSTVEKFVQEILWRTYWKGWLEQRPEVWRRYTTSRDFQIDLVENNGSLRKAHDQALDANTGIDCFDAWVTELLETGYLHNHARMWFASIWIFTLRLPWQLGADFFLRHLMDGDAASNTLSWRWVAGLQTRGKTYLARHSNIQKFSAGRFSPEGLSAQAHPLDDAPFEKPLMPELNAGFAPSGATLVLIQEDDCHPEDWVIPNSVTVVDIASVAATSHRSPQPAGERAATFTKGALADALDRAAVHFGISQSQVHELGDEDAPETLSACLDTLKATQVITSHATVGPARDQADRLRRVALDKGIGWTELARSWDRTFWPYATKGFFPFKEKIPSTLTELGIEIGAKTKR